MPVIKSNISAAATQGAIVLNMSDLRKQADAIIENAKQQAKQVIVDVGEAGAREAQELAEQMREQSRSEGFAAGQAEGATQGHDQAYQEATTQFQTLQNNWQQALQDWDQQREHLLSDAKHAILKVVKIFAEKVVHRVIDVDSTIIADQVAEAFACVMNPSELRVRICEADRQTLEQSMPELLQSFPNVQHARLIDDEQISRGGCVVEFGQGSIDATIETQLSRMVKLLIPSDTPTIVGDETPVHGDDTAAEAVGETKIAAEIESEIDVEVELNEEAGSDEEVDTGPADDGAQGDVVL